VRDRALARAIIGAALRRRGQIDAILQRMLDRPLSPNANLLSAILHIAAAQILFLDVPDHAAVDLAVRQAAEERGTRQAKGLVNGVLRRLVRERNAILSEPEDGARNTPGWLYRRWTASYGEATAAAIAAAHLSSPALDLSVKADPQLWAERLGGYLLPTGTVRVPGAQRIADLYGFTEGAWWVLDAAAALPAQLLGDVSGSRVADLCAAPGGKTAELAAVGAEVTAVDISESRLRRLRANLDRLRLHARLIAADVTKWQPQERFDAVLLDAPCTGTGTIRRHPDIPWIKQPDDVAALAALQERLLDRAAEMVRPGGLLVFSTCSLEPEEGIEQASRFLVRHGDFKLAPIRPEEIGGMDHLVAAGGTLRTLPSLGFGAAPEMRGMDGFFAARFRRS
jgi:16S rRNA (cytosine967-C5)-methyltransferase